MNQIQMKQFQEAYERMNRAGIEAEIRCLKEPCYESQLMAVAFPGFDVLSCSALALYQSHFLLFHELYRLQKILHEEGVYLHIHCMRIQPIPYPVRGRCRHFEESLMRFCGIECPDGSDLCQFHCRPFAEGQLDALSARWFYLDPDNYFLLDSDTAESFMKGAWEILRHNGELSKAFQTLGLPESADVKAVKERFRELARQYHPDVSFCETSRFVEINRAYSLLMRVLPRVRLRRNSY